MFKVPIDYQCAILVFHAASHPQCEQLPRNARQVARVARRGPARGEGRADARLPIGNRTTKGSSKILPYDAMPDPDFSDPDQGRESDRERHDPGLKRRTAVAAQGVARRRKHGGTA